MDELEEEEKPSELAQRVFPQELTPPIETITIDKIVQYREENDKRIMKALFGDKADEIIGSLLSDDSGGTDVDSEEMSKIE